MGVSRSKKKKAVKAKVAKKKDDVVERIFGPYFIEPGGAIVPIPGGMRGWPFGR